MGYILLEKKDLDKNRIIALPQESFDNKIEKVYYNVGSLEGISLNDFREHSHWGHDYIDLKISPQIKNTKLIRENLEKNLKNFSATIDISSLQNDETLIKRLIGHQKIKGDIYMLRCTPYEKTRKDSLKGKNFCIGFFIDEKDKVSFNFDSKDLFLNNEKIDLGNEFGFLTYGQDLKKIIYLDRIGNMEVHRSSLDSFMTRGTYGSYHENGPCIVLRNRPFKDSQLE